MCCVFICFKVFSDFPFGFFYPCYLGMCCLMSTVLWVFQIFFYYWFVIPLWSENRTRIEDTLENQARARRQLILTNSLKHQVVSEKRKSVNGLNQRNNLIGFAFKKNDFMFVQFYCHLNWVIRIRNVWLVDLFHITLQLATVNFLVNLKIWPLPPSIKEVQ